MMDVIESIRLGWEKLIQTAVWKSFFVLMQWIDWVAVSVILIGILYGIKKGFWKVFFDLIRALLIVVVTLEFADRVAGYLARYLGFIPVEFVSIMGFSGVLLISWMVVTFFIRRLRDMLVTKSSGFVRSLGGLILGSIY